MAAWRRKQSARMAGININGENNEIWQLKYVKAKIISNGKENENEMAKRRNEIGGIGAESGLAA
jgi:hypothetical protein